MSQSVVQDPVSFVDRTAAPADESSSSVALTVKISSDSGEPPSKRLCIATTSSADVVEKEEPKLEQRLGGILCCAVCLDLPRAAVYQCTNGHLMCAGCFNRMLADARIKDDQPTCPNCRVELSRSSCIRNLAVEKAVSELPAACLHCAAALPRHALQRHEVSLCPLRPGTCRYVPLGCVWAGEWRGVAAHEAACAYPGMKGAEVLPSVIAASSREAPDQRTVKALLAMLSFEKFVYNDVQLRPYRTDEYNARLYYETTRFSALSALFSLNVRLNDDRRDAHLTNERRLSYQLVLRGAAPAGRLLVHYTVVRGPGGRGGSVRPLPHAASHEFTEAAPETVWQPLELESDAECDRLLAAASMECRILMAQQPLS